MLVLLPVISDTLKLVRYIEMTMDIVSLIKLVIFTDLLLKLHRQCPPLF